MKPIKVGSFTIREIILKTRKVYAVSGMYFGEQLRKRYPTRREAINAAKDFDDELICHRQNLRRRTTWLDENQLADCESAIVLISKRRNLNLTQIVRKYLEIFPDSGREKSFEEAAEDLLKLKIFMLGKNQIRQSTLENLRYKLKVINKHFSKRLVNEITHANIDTFLRLQNCSPRQWNHLRGTISEVMKNEIKLGTITVNPADRVHTMVTNKNRGIAEFLSPAEAERIMHWVEDYRPKGRQKGHLTLYFAFCLFQGIRPDWRNGEITKIRPADVFLDEEYIRIAPFQSKTSLMARIRITAPMAAYLRAYPLEKFPICPPLTSWILNNARQKTGIAGKHDVLRHTFGTMLYAENQSITETARQMRDNENTVQRHYVNADVSQEEAKEFWAIRPKKKVDLSLVA